MRFKKRPNPIAPESNLGALKEAEKNNMIHLIVATGAILAFLHIKNKITAIGVLAIIHHVKKKQESLEAEKIVREAQARDMNSKKYQAEVKSAIETLDKNIAEMRKKGKAA